MIYHILPEAEPFSDRTGGAIARWVANVVGDDTQARIVCPRADRSWNVAEERIVRVRGLDAYYQALRLSRHRLPWRVSVLAIRSAFARLSAKLDAKDTVYIHNRPEFVPAFRRKDRAGPQVILHLHNSHLATYPTAIVESASADLTIFCSRFLEREALARLPELAPTMVIANGADPRRFYPSRSLPSFTESATPTILFVGRLVPEKGAHVLIEALRILDARGIPVAAKIVGSANFSTPKETNYTKRLRRRAASNITFLPHLWGADLAAEFRCATLFCCPSVWNESFGMVNVEAMASGLAVVASRVGGIADIFAEGGALLVPPDDAAALADALATLIGAPDLRRAIAAQGWTAFHNRFQWSAIRRRYYEALAGEFIVV